MSDPSIEDLLRSAGLKITRQRLRVMSCLQTAEQALCHAELEQLLRNHPEGALDRVTLYRVLESLVEHRLLQRLVDERGIYRFVTESRQAQHAAHAHFHCTQCGHRFCLGEVPPQPNLPEGFSADRIILDIEGRCAGCVPPLSFPNSSQP